jgi:putative peptidoglycan lipid II flippase
MPTFATHAANGKKKELAESVSYALRTVMFITLPATAGLIVAGKPIIRFLFERGRFTATATEWTSEALVCYSLGLFFFAGVNITVKAFYSLEKPGVPVKIGALCMLTNVILNLVLMVHMRQSGLALATSIAGMLNLALLLMALRKQLGSVKPMKNIIAAARISCATALMAWTVWAVQRVLETQTAHPALSSPGSLVLFSIITGILAYPCLARLMGCPELNEFMQILSRRARAAANSPSSDSEVSKGETGS